MDPIAPDTMLENIYDLPNLINTKMKEFAEIVKNSLKEVDVRSIKKIFLVGDGDSFHAALSSEMSFESIAGIPCEVASGQKFLDYKAPFLLRERRDDYLVIGISASGTTKRVIQSLKATKKVGVKTLAVTTRAESAITEIADSSIVLKIPAFPPSPGIRSFVASLSGLILIAVELGFLHERLSKDEKGEILDTLLSLSDVMQMAIESTEDVAKAAAEDFKNTANLIFLGSGPSYGTAIFSAAKVIEANGVFSFGQDLEEWSHVEFFAYPDDMPVFIIAPPGRSFWRALETVEMVKSYGHRTAVVASAENKEIQKHADYFFPISGDVREEFSSLVYHIGLDFFAYFLTKELDRHLFKSDNLEFQKLNEAYQKRDRIK